MRAASIIVIVLPLNLMFTFTFSTIPLLLASRAEFASLHTLQRLQWEVGGIRAGFAHRVFALSFAIAFFKRTRSALAFHALLAFFTLALALAFLLFLLVLV